MVQDRTLNLVNDTLEPTGEWFCVVAGFREAPVIAQRLERSCAELTKVWTISRRNVSGPNKWWWHHDVAQALVLQMDGGFLYWASGDAERREIMADDADCSDDNDPKG